MQIKHWLGIVVVAATCGLSQIAEAQGGKGHGPHRGGKAAAHMSHKGEENTNAQWSADPERGWVRAEEQQEQHDRLQTSQRTKKATQGSQQDDRGRTKEHSVKSGSIVGDY
ncbi:MAG: hypothetical protein ACREP8_07875 [Candidatus Binatia bacterium]